MKTSGLWRRQSPQDPEVFTSSTTSHPRPGRVQLAAKITELPTQLRRSITWDHGKEMAQHARFSLATGVPVYFCDPRSPWQRGSNENTNGLLRQYFPKRSDLAPFSQHDLDAAAAELNGRPRQTLRWTTPSQALDKALR
jgi:transposase, IS30 family